MTNFYGTHLRFLKPFLFSTSVLALAACGGGDEDGGGSGGPGLGTVPGNPGGSGTLGSYFVQTWSAHEQEAQNRRNHPKYTSQNSNWNVGGAVRQTNAILSSGVEYAHAAGLTGAGQIVAVIDGGFFTSHETLAGAIQQDFSSAADSHGTQVAAIIAGESSTFIGVAPGAKLVLEDFTNISGMTAATNYAASVGAVAQNNSWGPTDGNRNELLATSAGLQTFKNQGATPYLNAVESYANQGVVVFAVSNNPNATQIDLMAGLPGVSGYAGVEDGWLAVANGFPVFNGSGNLSNVYMVSSRCLQAAAWCITANGQWKHVPSDGGAGYEPNLGSSFAAPQVSGALALLAEAFPSLTPHQLRIRLLASADNSFFNNSGVNAGTITSVQLAPGFSHDASSVYGHGFLDIAAALLPIGGTSMRMANGENVDPTDVRFVAGSATGDAVTRALSNVDVDITDGLGAAFVMPGESLAGTTAPRALGAVRLSDALSANLSETRLAPARTGRSPFAEFEGRTIDLSSPFSDFSASVLLSDGSGDAGIEVTKSFGGDGLRFDLGVKLAHEESGLIGFGNKGADMAALRLGIAQDFKGGGFFSLGAEFGVANMDAPTVFTDISTARYNSFGAEFGRRGVFAKGDRLALGVSMPIAVTGGSAEITLPTSIDGTRSALTPIAFDLAPSERQIDLSVSYQMPLSQKSEMLFEVTHADNFGNQAGATDTAGVMAIKFAF